jgi:hypothetical protein
MHTYTVAALLALFVGAVVVALASRLLPGGLSGGVIRRFRRGGEGAGSGDASGSGEGGSREP